MNSRLKLKHHLPAINVANYVASIESINNTCIDIQTLDTLSNKKKIRREKLQNKILKIVTLISSSCSCSGGNRLSSSFI
ncbi:hypothetical protein DERF_011608 [Dermatophagoides farinae]|uniref:Uncharacterized protein n=1 Tax=Dermatophagoides farinae TaxID=6954 RepID=A0A922HXH4_DERFA|nr:hypothetical protein DERF_011608 [Dermatophagoides farinae]